jgi:hypothetical protein
VRGYLKEFTARAAIGTGDLNFTGALDFRGYGTPAGPGGQPLSGRLLHSVRFARVSPIARLRGNAYREHVSLTNRGRSGA